MSKNEEPSVCPPPKDLKPEDTNMAEPDADSPSVWECMPTHAFFKLFQRLDRSTLMTIRQICSSWKQTMDLEVGLKVKVDDKIPGNVAFINKVKVREARIVNLDNPAEDYKNLFLHLSSIERLILVGPVSPFWFNIQLPRFLNCTKLVLRGGFLTNHELQSDIDRISPIPSTQHTILLPALTSFEIIANEFSFPFFLPLSIRLRDPERAMQNEQAFTEVSLKTARNIAYLLLCIKSPKLKMLQVYFFQKAGLLLPPTHNWRFHPLEMFLERNKDTLKELYLPEFEGKHDLEHRVRSFPTNLLKLSILVSCFINEREEGRPQDSTYWKDLISSQVRLNAIDLQIADMPQVWISDVLSSICRNCNRTLSYVDLVIQMEENFEISFSIFENCTSLEVLRFSCRESEAFITDFCFLPTSLRKIRLTACFVILPIAEEIEKFKNLIMLELSTVMLDGDTHERTLSVLKEVLKLRNLNYVGINFNENAGQNNPHLREILQQFSLFWDHRFQFSGIKINYAYELQEGWSDEIFDEFHNDRDFINQREPETMASWASSPSGFDDDPRVILFQNVPLLLRTIAIHENGDEGSDISINESNDEFNRDDSDDDDDFW